VLGGGADPRHEIEQVPFWGVRRHGHGSEDPNGLRRLSCEVGKGSRRRSPSNLLRVDPIKAEVDALYADIGAQRNEFSPMREYAAVVAQPMRPR